MTVSVEFEENGGEYSGWFIASDVNRVSFNPANPKSISLDRLTIEMDERITQIDVDGRQHSVAEAWAIVKKARG